MDSYVVRIYRRNSSNAQSLAGLVELVDIDEQKAFTCFEELRAILGCKQKYEVRKETIGKEK